MSNQVYNKNVLIIDTYNIYIFNCELKKEGDKSGKQKIRKNNTNK